jgi:hypothetical protein
MKIILSMTTTSLTINERRSMRAGEHHGRGGSKPSRRIEQVLLCAITSDQLAHNFDHILPD